MVSRAAPLSRNFAAFKFRSINGEFGGLGRGPSLAVAELLPTRPPFKVPETRRGSGFGSIFPSSLLLMAIQPSGLPSFPRPFSFNRSPHNGRSVAGFLRSRKPLDGTSRQCPGLRYIVPGFVIRATLSPPPAHSSHLPALPASRLRPSVSSPCVSPPQNPALAGRR